MSALWLLAGLGNPGEKYTRTRHNAGFWFLDALDSLQPLGLKHERKFHGLAARRRLWGVDAVCLKPDTFMNESGRAVRAVSDYFDISPAQVVVAYDDLDLPPGTVRLKQGGGHGGHNGLKSLFAHLGSPDFWRIRIGIGHPGIREAVTPWVLGRASAADEAAIVDAIGRTLTVLPHLIQGHAGRAMQDLHSERPDHQSQGG